MLGLSLRDEFLGSQMPGTAIAFRRSGQSGGNAQPGALDQTPQEFLDITYPTQDIQTALRAICTSRGKRPIVIIGDRGRGKSHIMAVMHHAVQSPDYVEQWARDWGNGANYPTMNALTLERGFTPISEAVHNHEFLYLWDLLFTRHPNGQYYKGQFVQQGGYFPSRSLIEKMFEECPTVLILDEFQKWFDGLPEMHGDAKPREWASTFIQNLY